jgi:hypothetical protein
MNVIEQNVTKFKFAHIQGKLDVAGVSAAGVPAAPDRVVGRRAAA